MQSISVKVSDPLAQDPAYRPTRPPSVFDLERNHVQGRWGSVGGHTIFVVQRIKGLRKPGASLVAIGLSGLIGYIIAAATSRPPRWLLWIIIGVPVLGGLVWAVSFISWPSRANVVACEKCGQPAPSLYRDNQWDKWVNRRKWIIGPRILLCPKCASR